uniref:OTU domain-containing protein n=1 Tax=viral metagenome TaxID=1070528 RepID=A0A6C0E579_9ZZZZ
MSCLFDSISYFLRINSFETRQKICDYLEANNEIMSGLDTKLLLQLEDPNYISKMRRTTTWGGAIEIKAASNIWNIKIIVYIDRIHNKKIEFIPISGYYIGSIGIEWQGNHYVPIVRN